MHGVDPGYPFHYGTQTTIVVLISGSDTNLQALIDAQNTPALPNVEISLVLSNRKAAYEKPDLVVLAGWMHVLGEGFWDLVYIKERPIPVINLHPALPGEFDGVNGIERAYEAVQKGEVTRSGTMVDGGEPLVVTEMPFEGNEALEAYEERLHKVEWEIIVTGAKMVLDKFGCPKPVISHTLRKKKSRGDL
ncbi:formyl transferase [Armillaria luteobubalina]|uniref:phosphoribosylglycinamide formyltransferase 1 n=1 Tax=Armillaria luteobubalina TaxID=153913 RepID=A0AA39UYU8_9AGAR|nr:formyl transferase [Armillaria luteobubalina]